MVITFNYTVGAVIKSVTVMGYHINPTMENATVDVEWLDDWGATHAETVEVPIADMAVAFPIDAATEAKIIAAAEKGLDNLDF